MFVKREVLHVDGKTIVTAIGLVVDNIFNGEYKFKGMTYGISMPIKVNKSYTIKNNNMTRTNLLNQFFESKSDANEFLEALNQETLEKDFQNYMTNDRGELDAIDFVNEMCIESLSTECFEKWEDIKKELKMNRSLLKKFNYAI